MKATVTPVYGSPAVLQVRDVERPRAKAHEVLIEMRATTVTAGDLRLRAADFPALTALPGRLALGLRGPRNAVQGTVFAGRVVEVGPSVTAFAVGDDVFGLAMHGAYAEYLALRDDGAIAKMPRGLSYEQAAGIPYGAVTALRYLRDLAKVAPGERVLVLGASGGVGRFAVQVAKHLGAHVTAMTSRQNVELVKSLGADHVIDRDSEALATLNERYDVVFDTADASTFGKSLPSLTPKGRYLTLFITLGLLARMALGWLVGGPQPKATFAMGTREDMETLRALVERGALKPVLGRKYSFEQLALAHAEAADGRARGSVIVVFDERARSSMRPTRAEAAPSLRLTSA